MAQHQAIEVERLPSHMQSSARAYVEEGQEPGGFLRAVLTDSFVMAYGRADTKNRAAMDEWAGWLFNDVPKGAWGSEEEVQEWVEQGGLEGL